jgi:type IV pilus modification protein PilV
MFITANRSTQTTFPTAPTARRQRDDTMIEVLVTVIIADGVPGAATLQVTTLKNLSSSHSASVAAIVAEDFGERMLAKPIAMNANAYVHSSAPAAYPDCVANACTPAQMASYDMGTWWAELTNLSTQTHR